MAQLTHSLVFSLKDVVLLAFGIFVLVFLPKVSLAQAGALDTSFDSDGMVTTDWSASSVCFITNDSARSVAIQADGKIVVAGDNGSGPCISDFALARYNADGSLDPSFDGDGKVTTDFAGSSDRARSVAIQADGKIVVAGNAYSGFALARYNADGSLDTSFDGDGKVTTDFSDYSDIARSVAVQADGKIVAAGSTLPSTIEDADFALARYNADGSLDASFDGDGKVTTDFADYSDIARSVAIQADGKIVVAGEALISGTSYDFALARYNADGTLDTSFDGDGKITTDYAGKDDLARSVAIQGDGKIVAAGRADVHPPFDFGLARYNADGSLDTSFDGDGKVTTGFLDGSEEAWSVAIQADGKLVVAGVIYLVNDFALARYNADGTLDTSFDGDGKITTDFSGSLDRARSVAIQADGKIVVAGIAHIPSPGTGWDFALARYWGNGQEPEEMITDLADDVQDLLDSGDLTPTQAGDLTAKLDGATEKLSLGKTDKAIKKLEDFIREVEKLKSKGVLGAADAEALIAVAQTIIDDINAALPKWVSEATEKPSTFKLQSAYPNPFNPTTTISYDLPRASDATLTVYDVLGREVSVLASGTKPAGTYEVSFEATGLPSGIYFYRFEAGDYVETKRMVLLK